MRTLMILLFGVFVAVAPSIVLAEDSAVDMAVTTVKEHPGTTAGAAGCAAILIFPPAAIWCLATVGGGAGIDVATK